MRIVIDCSNHNCYINKWKSVGERAWMTIDKKVNKHGGLICMYLTSRYIRKAELMPNEQQILLLLLLLLFLQMSLLVSLYNVG